MDSAQPADQQCPGRRPGGGRPPLISRGYTDAPAGTAVVAGDPAGGTNLVELRIKDGQKVKRDEIIAVLSNYPKADVALRMAEANLTKLKQIHDTVLMGTRVTEIAMQEATLKSSIESDKLQTLQRSRSGKPPDVKELEAGLAEQSLEREKVRLELAEDDAEERSRPVSRSISPTSRPRSTMPAAAARRPWSARRSTAWWCRSFRARASASRRPASPRSST